MEIVLQACHAWNIILIGLQSLLYKVLLGLDKGNIYPHWVTGNLILKYNLFQWYKCKTGSLDKPWAHLFQNIKIGTIIQDGWVTYNLPELNYSSQGTALLRQLADVFLSKMVLG